VQLHIGESRDSGFDAARRRNDGPFPVPSLPVPSLEPTAGLCFSSGRGPADVHPPAALWEGAMSLGLILIVIVIIYLLGGFSGRFGGYGYGMGHSGMGIGGVILVVLLVLLLLGKL
jgi:hypothetical protein